MDRRAHRRLTYWVWACICSFLTILLLIGALTRRNSKPGLGVAAQLLLREPRQEAVLGFGFLNQTQVIYVARGQERSEVRLLDRTTLVSSVLREATAQLQRYGVQGGATRDIRLSPDCSRLLLAGSRDQSAPLFVLDLRGWSLLRTPLCRSDGPACWFGGSEGIVQFVGSGSNCEARVFELRAGSLTRIRLPFGAPYGPVAYSQPDSCFLSVRKRGAIMEMSRIRLWPAPALADKSAIAVEADGVEESPAFSPDGLKLAWVQLSSRKGLKPSFKPSFPFLSFSPRSTRMLCIADLGSGQTWILGSSTPGAAISDLRWSDTGSEIGFLWADGLYSVPVRPRK